MAFWPFAAKDATNWTNQGRRPRSVCRDMGPYWALLSGNDGILWLVVHRAIIIASLAKSDGFLETPQSRNAPFIHHQPMVGQRQEALVSQRSQESSPTPTRTPVLTIALLPLDINGASHLGTNHRVAIAVKLVPAVGMIVVPRSSTCFICDEAGCASQQQLVPEFILSICAYLQMWLEAIQVAQH